MSWPIRFVSFLLRVAWGLVKVALFLLGAVVVAVGAAWLTVNHHFEESEVTVPDLAGLTPEEAMTRLALVELDLRVDARRPNEGVPAGRIYWQEPRPEAFTRRRRQVVAWVSTGPSSTLIPDLLGQSSRRALLTLGQVGLSAGLLVSVPAGGSTGGQVLAQEPAAGSQVPGAVEVDLLVSSGPPRRHWVMPDFRGRTVGEVESILSPRGLRISEVQQRVVPGARGGLVHAQVPEPGTRVSSETGISLVVAEIVEVPTGDYPSPRLYTE